MTTALRTLPPAGLAPTTTDTRTATLELLAPFGISLPPGRCWTSIRWTWARTDCALCGGSGQRLVSAFGDNTEPHDPEHAGIWYRQPCYCLDGPPDQIVRDVNHVLNRLRQASSHLRDCDDRAAAQWQRVHAEIGPRRPGISYFDGFWHTWLTVQSVDITPDVGDPDRLTWSMWVRGPSGYTWITRAPWNTLLGDHLAATVATLPAGTVAAPTGPATISVLTALPPRARRRVLSRFRRAASRLTRRLRRR